ncbi:MAG: DUF6499 domain-containing protein [Pseudomonadota bacterium]
MYKIDWRKEEVYNYTEGHNLYEWMWEFIRRNPRYWEYWAETKQLYEKEIERIRNKKKKPANASGLGLGGLLGFALSNYDPEANNDIMISESTPPNHRHFSVTRFSAEKIWGFYNLYPPETDSPLAFTYRNQVFSYSSNELASIFMVDGEIHHPEKAVSAYCLDKHAIFEIETDKTQKFEGNTGSEELRKNINNIEFTTNEVTTPQTITGEAIQARINPATYSIILLLPESLKKQIITSNEFTIKIDSPRYLFGTFLEVNFKTSHKEKQMLRLAWLGCT